MEQITRDLHFFADGQELAQGCRMLLHSQETLSLTPAWRFSTYPIHPRLCFLPRSRSKS